MLGLDAGCWGLDAEAGCWGWMLGAGCWGWMLGAGCWDWMLGAGCWCDTGCHCPLASLDHEQKVVSISGFGRVG